ncbi:MAG: biopolymer transporter ExbD [Verrucomicrobiota bacterium]
MKAADSVLKMPRRLPYKRGPLEMTAVLDIILLLLIFFLLNSTFVLQPGIFVDPPRSPFEAGARANAIMVTVVMRERTRPGGATEAEPLIFYRDELQTLEEIRAALGELPGGRGSRPVVINADQNVPLGLVTEIMEAAMLNDLSVVIGTQPESPDARLR